MGGVLLLMIKLQELNLKRESIIPNFLVLFYTSYSCKTCHPERSWQLQISLTKYSDMNVVLPVPESVGRQCGSPCMKYCTVDREDPSVLLNYHPDFKCQQDRGISILISLESMRLKYLINKDEYWGIPVTSWFFKFQYQEALEKENNREKKCRIFQTSR